MPVVRLASGAMLLCALVIIGCRGEPPNCPSGTVNADPREIPDGSNQTSITVEVRNPSPENGFEVVTELSAITGTIEDPFALATTYACPFDVSGEVEICVTTTYADPDAGVAGLVEASPKRRGPNVYLSNPLECSTTRCSVVVCPDVKNQCPEVSSLTVEPQSVPEGGTATIKVVAEDPDDNPEPLVTTLSARHGTITDPNASEATYECDENVGGVIEICVHATDGDSSCDVERCTTVRCPGDPLENTCPIIASVDADPNPITSTEDPTTAVSVDASDPDDFPVPLRIEWTADTGVFGDRFAADTTFTCGASGPVEVCVKANDGDPECDETQCMTVECPGEIPPNVCPNLNNINALQTRIELPDTSTEVETRGWDTDEKPFPLALTLYALWGSFENTENLQCEEITPECPNSPNVVFQNARYICDRPGWVELCVDATDGACMKTLCTDVRCPDDIPVPP